MLRVSLILYRLLSVLMLYTEKNNHLKKCTAAIVVLFNYPLSSIVYYWIELN